MKGRTHSERSVYISRDDVRRANRRIRRCAKLFQHVLHESIPRLRSNAESKRTHQPQYLVIAGQDNSLHDLKPARAGDFDKAENEVRTDPVVLSSVRDRNGELATGPVCIDDIARNSDFGFQSVFTYHRDLQTVDIPRCRA